MTAAQWIHAMPDRFFKRIMKSGNYALERRLWARFQDEINQGILPKDDPMKPLYDLLDLYCRSALGSLNPDISAMGYANFYVSEL